VILRQFLNLLQIEFKPYRFPKKAGYRGWLERKGKVVGFIPFKGKVVFKW